MAVQIRPDNHKVGQETMNADLILRLAVVFVGGLPALVSAQEAALNASPGSRLVEVESQNATRMLQLRWRSELTGSAPHENLFWFAERKPRGDGQALDTGDVNAIGNVGWMQATEGDGPDGWSRTVISIDKILSTQIVIKLERTTGKWSDKLDSTKSVKVLDEVLKVPRRSVGPATQGKIEFTARWWSLAQQSDAS